MSPQNSLKVKEKKKNFPHSKGIYVNLFFLLVGLFTQNVLRGLRVEACGHSWGLPPLPVRPWPNPQPWGSLCAGSALPSGTRTDPEPGLHHTLV